MHPTAPPRLISRVRSVVRIPPHPRYPPSHPPPPIPTQQDPKVFPRFPLPTTARPYPQWALAALPHVDLRMRRLVGEALFDLDYKVLAGK